MDLGVTQELRGQVMGQLRVRTPLESLLMEVAALGREKRGAGRGRPPRDARSGIRDPGVDRPRVPDRRPLECSAGVTRQVLLEAETRGNDALVTGLHLFERRASRPVPVHAGFEPVDSMGVKIEVDERCAGEVRPERPGGGIQYCRKLCQGDGLNATLEVERRTACSRDLSGGAVRELAHGQLDIAPALGRVLGVCIAVELAVALGSFVNFANQRVSDLLRGEPVRFAAKPDQLPVKWLAYRNGAAV